MQAFCIIMARLYPGPAIAATLEERAIMAVLLAESPATLHRLRRFLAGITVQMEYPIVTVHTTAQFLDVCTPERPAIMAAMGRGFLAHPPQQTKTRRRRQTKKIQRPQARKQETFQTNQGTAQQQGPARQA